MNYVKFNDKFEAKEALFAGLIIGLISGILLSPIINFVYHL